MASRSPPRRTSRRSPARACKAYVDGQAVALGNAKMLAELGLERAAGGAANARRDQGETVMFVVVEGAIAGLVSVADPVKETTPACAQGAARLSASASSWPPATTSAPPERWPAASASTRSAPTCCPRTRPGSSASCRRRAARSRWPATASTTPRRWRRPTSASPWAPAPTWRSRAPGFTLVKGDLDGIVRARRLSLATMRNIRQNLFFALVYNAAGVPIAAGILYPFLGILISPIFAAAAMSLSSVSVIGNALRLRSVRLDG